MPSDFKPIAVTGVSAIFPGSTDAHGFWRDILAGRDLITDVPESRWLLADHYDPDPRAADKTYCKRGSFLGDIDFDPIEFGVQPAAIAATDTCQLLALIAARQVLDDAMKNQFREIDRERASVILGRHLRPAALPQCDLPPAARRLDEGASGIRCGRGAVG